MEADWEIEIGNQAPVIDAGWRGFVDLRHAPERAIELPETQDLPELADALTALNAPSSTVWSAKCDVWRPDAHDPDELDAPRGEGKCAVACYIDLLPCAEQEWPDPADAVAFCRQVCATLHDFCLRSCRVDLIVRRALMEPGEQRLGITAYLTACGPSLKAAHATLASALAAFAETLAGTRLPATRASKLQ
jgi:hypothetical protein